jgi:2-keto-4-pentenoate hydratase/2-oxohepta-3-ene-1,7-dioic acid hydratase in catechol pathway
MKLVTFKTADGRVAPGVLLDDLSTIAEITAYSDMLELIDSGSEGLATAQAAAARPERTTRLSDVTLLAPIPVPRSIRDCSVFEEHLKNASKFMRGPDGQPVSIPEVWYRQPPYYKGNRFSVIGPGDEIVWPPACQRLDYELEVAIVLGRAGRDIPKATAHDWIFGYMIFNDMSARDFQSLDMQGRLGPAKGKDFDTGNIMGPWLVTADEVVDPYALKMTGRLNGDEVGGGSTADMYHRWDDILAFISRDETLHPGEVIGSGTVGGGTLLEHGRALSPGDVIEFEVTGLGVLRNRVIKLAA